MIAGTLAFEDYPPLHAPVYWRSFADCVRGSHRKAGLGLCNATLFAKAIGIALDPDGNTGSAEDYDALVDGCCSGDA
jgi:hypothetical protein